MDEWKKEFADVIDALRAGPEARVGDGFAEKVVEGTRDKGRGTRDKGRGTRGKRLVVRWGAGIAAAVVVGMMMLGREDVTAAARGRHGAYVQAYVVSALLENVRANRGALDAAVARLAAEQKADGGWENGLMTARNAAALRGAAAAGVAGARDAYRRAARYLRLNGLTEVGVETLARDRAQVFARAAGRDR